MEIPEETFLLIGQFLSRDQTIEEKGQNIESLVNSKTLLPTFAAAATDDDDLKTNQMMNSAILVCSKMNSDQHDDQHSTDTDSFTYSVATSSDNDSDQFSDDFNHIPPIGTCDKSCPILTTTSTTNEEDDEFDYPVPDLIETFAEPLSSKSPLCDYTVYEQQPPQPRPNGVYKQDAKSSSLLRGRRELGETAWWDIANGHNTQQTDR